MKTTLYNQKGENIGEFALAPEIFEVELNSDLLHQVLVSQMSNRRQGTAHTKTRGQVRGGGRKPWRQKGTGRARHGSIRSPIWRGGGVTFGPTNEKNYKKRIPKEMKRKALFMSLSGKVKDNELVVIDKLQFEDHKTKTFKEFLNSFSFLGKKSLIILPSAERRIILGARNIPEVETMQAKNINALDLLSFKHIIIPQSAITVIKDTF